MPGKTRASKGSRGPSRGRTTESAKALRPNPFLALVDTVRKEVDTRLAGLLDAKVDAAGEQDVEVLEMVRAFRDLCLRGGKRLRAALLVAGYRAASASADLEPALDAGVAIELLHAYFLVHDDWMDRDDTRRGGPAVHKILSERYDSARLGEASAILAGDLGVALATEALARVDVPASRLPRVFAAFAQMQADAVAGQQIDVIARGEDVEKTYTLKTGSYTVAGPLRMGALLAGGSPELISALERFALPAGVAFQLRDDLLSAFGDPSETGKPFANDIRSGKRTALIQRAFELAKGKDKKALAGAWGNARAGVKLLREATDILTRCGARAAVEERISELSARALASVDVPELAEARRTLLLGAVDALTDRRS
ncbi:MAG TPA: polyprenyl synthetase family protein [Polyangiaceae bacterium]|nr:polyprenyl synthetase family protein [Polyangiaceae bacterium]